jgi:serine/threonine-protein kinase
MGEVYLGERADGRFDQKVAVKLVKRGMDSREILRRFARERRILARLQHPGIARLLDGGETHDGRPYFVMERVEGERITDYCRTHSLPLEERLRLVASCCEAVDAAHRALVVHRDLKPSNLLVTFDGQVKLLDFGIARMLSEGQAELSLTDPGYRALTPEYGAPETITGKPVSTATDVYSAGVLLFVLLSGTHPTMHEGETREAAISSVVDREPLALSAAVQAGPDEASAARAANRGSTPASLARTYRGDLDHILARAMRKAPTERYPTALAFAEDLERYLRHEPVSAAGESVGYRAGTFMRRHRPGVLLERIEQLS